MLHPRRHHARLIVAAATVALTAVALTMMPAAPAAHGCSPGVPKKECEEALARIKAYAYDQQALAGADDSDATSWQYPKLVAAIKGGHLKSIMMIGNYCPGMPKAERRLASYDDDASSSSSYDDADNKAAKEAAAKKASKEVCDSLPPWRIHPALKDYKVLPTTYTSIGKNELWGPDYVKHEAVVTPEQSKALQALLAETKYANAITVKLKEVDEDGDTQTVEPWQYACTKSGYEKCQNMCIYYYEDDAYGADKQLMEQSGLGSIDCPLDQACCTDD